MKKRLKKFLFLVWLVTFSGTSLFGNLITGEVPVASAAADATEREYNIEIGPITGTATANYVYGSIFNPAGSSRTVVIKRIRARSDANAAANYVNLSLRRTTAASAGSQVVAGDIPRKNTDTVNPVAEVRHTNVTATLAGSADSRLLGQPMAGAAGAFYSQRDIMFGENDEKLILQPGEGVALYQEAAGSTAQLVRLFIEWEEVTSAPTAATEYMMALPRVENAAAANYVYNSFFNPVGSTKTAIVKRIWFGSETCDTAAVYTNNITLKRTTAASAGTLVAVANIPKKHTGSANSIMEVRHTNVTVTTSGGADALLGHVTPCGTTAQSQGWQELNFYNTDEKLILQPGQGIALISSATGDIDQLNRMFVEWQEVSSAPTADNQYLWASSRVENVAVALGTTMFTYFNPTGSGKTMLVRRIGVRVDADTTATYSTFNYQRITAASGGNLIAAADLPKKHTGSANSAMQVRWCGATCATAITATYSGARSVAASGISDSGILKTNGAGAAGQVIGQREIVFGANEPFVLKEGEGLGFYLNYLAGDLDHYSKVFIEWEEVASAPTTQNQYLIDVGPIAGSTATSYNYASFFNPSTSGKTMLVKRVSARVDTVAAGVYVPMRLRYTSAASGGTQIAVADIPKKHTSSANSAADIRRSGVTNTYTQGTGAQLISLVTPGAAGVATAPAMNGYREMIFENDENIILYPGMGFALSHDTSAGDADLRVKFLVEWEEVNDENSPATLQNHILSHGPIAGNTTSGYVYATMFNPINSGKTYILQRIGIRASRTGALTVPGYIPVTLRRISSASAGTLLAQGDIPKKHGSSTVSTAEFRSGGVTATLSQSAASRWLGVSAAGAVVQKGDTELEIVPGDELVLLPGEGVALYQESAAGDANMQYHLSVAWDEIDGPILPLLSFSISDTAVGFGTLLSSGAKYATGDTVGSGSDSADAHTFSASTNATDGYTISVDGTTLTCAACGNLTVTPIGGTAAVSNVGTEQFGMRVIANSGTGSANTPYNTTSWAFDTAAFPDVVATGAGDEVTTTFGVRYLSNISANTESGSYNSVITYIVTASF